MTAAARFHRLTVPGLHRARRPGGPRGLQGSHVVPVVLVAALALVAGLARVLLAGMAPDSAPPALFQPVAAEATPAPAPLQPAALADDDVPEMPRRSADAISL